MNNSKEEFFIFSLFSFGISVKNIQVLVFPQFSKDVVKNVVKRKYPNNTYRRQSKEEGEKLLSLYLNEAEANRELASSITDQLVQYRALEKWDGVLPRMTGNSAVPFINVDPTK